MRKTIATLLMLVLSGGAAAGGCCSHHGGVSGCNEKSGMLMCEDKTLSEKCTCKDWKDPRGRAPVKKAAPRGTEAEKRNPQ